jgi:hypothetical protein
MIGVYDWVPVPGSRVGDQEPPLDDHERVGEPPADRHTRERRCHARLELVDRIRAGQVDDDERSRMLDRRDTHLPAGSYAELAVALNGNASGNDAPPRVSSPSRGGTHSPIPSGADTAYGSIVRLGAGRSQVQILPPRLRKWAFDVFLRNLR